MCVCVCVKLGFIAVNKDYSISRPIEPSLQMRALASVQVASLIALVLAQSVAFVYFSALRAQGVEDPTGD